MSDSADPYRRQADGGPAERRRWLLEWLHCVHQLAKCPSKRAAAGARALLRQVSARDLAEYEALTEEQLADLAERR
jgi:hypothetical protein